jgi:hypothetical protein
MAILILKKITLNCILISYGIITFSLLSMSVIKVGRAGPVASFFKGTEGPFKIP